MKQIRRRSALLALVAVTLVAPLFAPSPFAPALLAQAPVPMPADSNAAVPTQTLKGLVRDQQTQQPIGGASIAVIGTRLGGVSHADGTYRVERVPVGRRTIRISVVGYEPVTTDLIITSGHQAVFDAELVAAVVRRNEVVVTADDPFTPINETALVSANAFTLDDVKRYAGSREDPARMAQNFAGVFSADTRRNDIIIRGGSPTELLWRLDGIDIPNPNHFATQGATGGPVNALNANLLANSDFLSGAFPADYGTKLSGVFDLRTRRGNAERYEFVAQMAFAGFEGLAEGPVPGVAGGSFIASYRKSTLEVLNGLGISFGFFALPRYQDATFKVDLPVSNRDHIAVLGLGGLSDIDIFQSTQDSVFTGDFDITNGTDLGVVGVTWQRLFTDQLVGKLSLSTVWNRYRTTVDSLTADESNHVLGSDPWFSGHSVEGYHSARYRLGWTPSSRNYFTASAEARMLSYAFDEERTTSRAADGRRYRVLDSGSSVQALGSVNWNWRPTDALTFNTGLFAQYLGVSSRFSIEPRAAVAYALDDAQSVNLGFGIHRQAQPLLTYFRETANRDLDFTQSVHYVVGYTNRLASDLLVKVEGYYKAIGDAPVQRDSASSYSLLNAGANFGGVGGAGALVGTGTGRAYGVELSLVKHFADGYYATATGSLFRQFYTGSDGIERAGAFDNRYVVNLLAGYEWTISPTYTMEFSGKYTIAGGAPYTPVDLAASRLNGSTTFDDGHRYSLRNDPYARLDLRVDFRNNFGAWALVSYVSVENVLNTNNIQERVYNRRFDRVDVVNQLGIFPIGGIRFEF